MASDREYRFEQALADCKTTANVADVARHWGIPATTLRQRLAGSTTNIKAKEGFQRLSPWQEGFVVDWILQEERCGRAPTKAQVRGFAGKIIKASSNESLFGKNWINGFLHRNPLVKTKVGKLLSSLRAQYTTRGQVNNFFDRLERVIKDKGIKTANITNIDENGV